MELALESTVPAGLQALGQLLIGKDTLDGALGVVKVAADAADGDVVALLRGHLQVLDAADLALGIKDSDARARSVGKAGECCLAGVADVAVTIMMRSAPPSLAEVRAIRRGSICRATSLKALVGPPKSSIT